MGCSAVTVVSELAEATLSPDKDLSLPLTNPAIFVRCHMIGGGTFWFTSEVLLYAFKEALSPSLDKVWKGLINTSSEDSNVFII